MNAEREINAKYRTEGEANQTGSESYYKALDISQNELNCAGDITVTVPNLKPMCKRTRSTPHSYANSARNRDMFKTDFDIISTSKKNVKSKAVEITSRSMM